MKLLDGSLAGKGSTNGEYGAKYGVIGAKLTDDQAAAMKELTDTGADGSATVGASVTAVIAQVKTAKTDEFAQELGFKDKDAASNATDREILSALSNVSDETLAKLKSTDNVTTAITENQLKDLATAQSKYNFHLMVLMVLFLLPTFKVQVSMFLQMLLKAAKVQLGIRTARPLLLTSLRARPTLRRISTS
jgi:ABC-type Na+ efflux pump permease subunit